MWLMDKKGERGRGRRGRGFGAPRPAPVAFPGPGGDAVAVSPGAAVPVASEGDAARPGTLGPSGLGLKKG